MMMNSIKKPIAALILVSVFGASACVSDDGYRPGEESISIPYDPYNFDPDELLQEAQAHCGAFGLSAVFDDETIDPQSVRWRYRHFNCV